MTEREFDEKLRARYHAAASSWTPETKTRDALVERLTKQKAPRRAPQYLRPAVALCCCALAAAAALFAWQGQTTDLPAVSEETVQTQGAADAAAPYAAATAGAQQEAEDAAGSGGETADRVDAVSPKQAEPNAALAAMAPETYADTEQAQNDAGAVRSSASPLTGEEARTVAELGALLPASQEALPEETAYQETLESGTVLMLLCTGTSSELSVRVSAVTAEQQERLVSVDEPETYDLTLCGLPLAESVPEDRQSRVENPIFMAEELSVSVLEARQEPEEGTMRFGVLCGDFAAEYVCKGMTPQEAYDAVTSAAYFTSGT
ncbi:hypothetical protein [Anaeromassilibacillus sp. An200]|uniref:hypothetical protein n=1 Tax=Anaeromassilibacillus sp. An200 TaxID=1965587 RepID=UPI000B3A8A83|nr:hypothetical protein [Anaeromassilibacillus sp. An200]OUP13296.1 hypothetical protein B5F35_04630 [Anaeromassilibacillus sp. An200]